MSEDNTRRKKGRPKASTPLEHDCKCRFTDEQLSRLDAYCKRNQIKRAQAIRFAVLSMLDSETKTGAEN